MIRTVENGTLCGDQKQLNTVDEMTEQKSHFTFLRGWSKIAK
jgi:hypothetical protein